jgi:DNA-binding transcriptional MerR regulator
VLVDVASARDDNAPLASARAQRNALLKEEDLRSLETTYASPGITAAQIIEVFSSRGVKFSEASFRKYVQQGLLPRSRRVGRKGKHRGSLGVYPAKTIRRINTVKSLMADGYTIEEIQGQFLLYTDLIEGVAENLAELFSKFDKDQEQLEAHARRELAKDMTESRRVGDALVEKLGDLARRIVAPRADHLRLAGAAGGAEDLL